MSSSPSTKLLRKNTRIARKIILAHFWGQLGVNKNGLQIDLKLPGWMSYLNWLMELCLCLVVFVYRNIAIFGNIWSNFCLIHSDCWFYDHVFSRNHGTHVCFLCETQKYVEVLNNTWMITFYIGILAIFGIFWANICLVRSTHLLSGCILTEIMVGRYSLFG